MSIDRLQTHYGFSKMPFGRDIPPQGLHLHPAHREAVARTQWCVSQRQMGVITGLRGIHTQIVTALGGSPAFYSGVLASQTAHLLATELDERSRLPVVVIDEAHMLSNTDLEALRMLTNTDMDTGSHFALLLIGQPTLRRRLKLAILAALDQRISTRYTITGMSFADTTDYISHHLKFAGRSDTLFSDDAITAIHQASRGYPRAVNNLAVSSLIATYAADKAIVDLSATQSAITENSE